MIDLVLKSLEETVLMVGLSSALSILLGLPLAILLFMTDTLSPMPRFHSFLGFVVNGFRSLPYIILMVILMPVTKVLIGSTIGTMAAVIPLTIAGILLVARVGEGCFQSVPLALLEVGLAYGATKRQIIWTLLLPESLPHLVSGLTTIIINLIGFSAMAGAVGGGGLGDLAIRYGYQRYDFNLMFMIVLILLVIVQTVQMCGSALSRALTK